MLTLTKEVQRISQHILMDVFFELQGYIVQLVHNNLSTIYPLPNFCDSVTILSVLHYIASYIHLLGSSKVDYLGRYPTFLLAFIPRRL